MALWECAECTAKYSVGAPKCPQCGSVVRVNEATQPQEEEQEMAKVTLHGGPSNDAANAEASEHAPAEASPEAPAESGYEDWTVEQLKDQLTERGLPKSGKRDDLVQRLRDDDAQDTE